ncbi:MAG: hypothetical protein KF690_00650 [Bacteroidetes bacterium]|nr:hypothetical protein [Bacteroidota bacterium]
MEYMLKMRTEEGVQYSPAYPSKRNAELQYEKMRLRLEKSGSSWYELLLLEREEPDEPWEILSGRLSDADEEPDEDEDYAEDDEPGEDDYES